MKLHPFLGFGGMRPEPLQSRDVGPNGPNKKHSLKEQLWQLASTTSTVAPLRVARRLDGSQDKQIYHCMMAGNMPLATKCHINNQKTHIIPKTNLDRLRQTGRCLQLRSFTFVALHDHYSGSF